MLTLPPYTGDIELDAWTTSVAQYLINQPATLVYNRDTGIITDPEDTSIVGFIDRYLHVKYADDRTGTNFGDSPVDRFFYGLHNSDSPIESTIPSEYTWFENPTGFGLTDKLFFRNLGGRGIDFFIGSVAPSYRWNESDANAIDLDDLLGAGTVGTDELEDRSVTTVKIGFDAVTNAELADDAVNVENLNTTGVPGPDTYLNGDMEWKEIAGAGLNYGDAIASVSGTNIDLDLDLIDKFFYKLSGAAATSGVTVQPFATYAHPNGSTLTLANLASQTLYIVSGGPDIVLLSSGAIGNIEIAQGGKCELVKLTDTVWLADGTGLTSTTLDPSVTYIITEASEEILTEAGEYIIEE